MKTPSFLLVNPRQQLATGILWLYLLTPWAAGIFLYTHDTGLWWSLLSVSVLYGCLFIGFYLAPAVLVFGSFAWGFWNALVTAVVIALYTGIMYALMLWQKK